MANRDKPWGKQVEEWKLVCVLHLTGCYAWLYYSVEGKHDSFEKSITFVRFWDILANVQHYLNSLFVCKACLLSQQCICLSAHKAEKWYLITGGRSQACGDSNTRCELTDCPLVMEWMLMPEINSLLQTKVFQLTAPPLPVSLQDVPLEQGSLVSSQIVSGI